MWKLPIGGSCLQIIFFYKGNYRGADVPFISYTINNTPAVPTAAIVPLLSTILIRRHTCREYPIFIPLYSHQDVPASLVITMQKSNAYK